MRERKKEKKYGRQIVWLLCCVVCGVRYGAKIVMEEVIVIVVVVVLVALPIDVCLLVCGFVSMRWRRS